MKYIVVHVKIGANNKQNHLAVKSEHGSTKMVITILFYTHKQIKKSKSTTNYFLGIQEDKVKISNFSALNIYYGKSKQISNKNSLHNNQLVNLVEGKKHKEMLNKEMIY